MEGPANIFEVGVIQEVLMELLHPDADLLHADAPNLRQRIPEHVQRSTSDKQGKTSKHRYALGRGPPRKG